MQPRALIFINNEVFRRGLVHILRGNFEVYEFEFNHKSLLIAQELAPTLIITEFILTDNKTKVFIEKVHQDAGLSMVPIMVTFNHIDEEHTLQRYQFDLVEPIRMPANPRVLLLKAKSLIQKSPLKNRRSVWRNKVNPYGFDSFDYNHEFVEQVTNYIQMHISNPTLTVKNISQYLNMTVSTFERYFKKNFHTSCKNFIRDQRLEKAMILMRSGLTNTSDVAFSVGFNSVSYFCKCFKDKYQITTSKVIQESELN